jgi:hypothetical protein
MKIRLAIIYGQLQKFLNEINDLDEHQLNVMLNRNSIQLKLINDFLYTKAGIPRLLSDYEYKYPQYPPNIGVGELLLKLDTYGQTELTSDIIAELKRMREEVAARTLFLDDLKVRISILLYDIIKYKEMIRDMFDKTDELYDIYYQYVEPFYNVPKLYRL